MVLSQYFHLNEEGGGNFKEKDLGDIQDITREGAWRDKMGIS